MKFAEHGPMRHRNCNPLVMECCVYDSGLCRRRHERTTSACTFDVQKGDPLSVVRPPRARHESIEFRSGMLHRSAEWQSILPFGLLHAFERNASCVPSGERTQVRVFILAQGRTRSIELRAPGPMSATSRRGRQLRLPESMRLVRPVRQRSPAPTEPHGSGQDVLNVSPACASTPSVGTPANIAANRFMIGYCTVLVFLLLR